MLLQKVVMVGFEVLEMMNESKPSTSFLQYDY